MGRPDVAGDRRLRLASSSPDVKALFNSQPYIFDYEDTEDPQQPNYVQGPSLEYWTPLPPIVRYLNFFVFALLSLFDTGIWNSTSYKAYRRCSKTRIRLAARSKDEG